MALEIERKFLIRLPDSDTLSSCRIQEITQTYLRPRPDDPGLERRVRRITENGTTVYTTTEKRSLKNTGAAVRTENEWEISAEEYAKRYEEAFTELTKTRYSFPHAGHVVEIDVYPHAIGGDAMEGLAVMEIELSDESEAIEFPPQIEILRELTGTREFSNKALAKPVK